ncbi:hypothetical protein G6W47_19210 [Streptomyces sp. CAI-21]|uniref:Uncharacterized protein n=2 Tax=Streptomyces TaxID=1883 RepID=A0ACC7XVI5_9ACTN|nr:hypothetical protein [Streptomyces sp. McG6]MBT2886568.1 hypothetical protein [Streptomyces sp. McG5]MBT2892144.1 hypothetical protein [Streptomyces sp. McG2]NUV73548.1 hypothetical protein [Streptomyces fungicidicus]NUW09032.1 hypothetical protein [Streptomyces sp. CAI-21]NVI30895.1 hypothetical protein [Streptomyces sp. CAI-17]PAX84875.1 hypothetical protein CLM82_32605 [Streptomyces albidoflavus]PKA34126.1 hypothetical protein SM8_007600 [Streptomyces sp. SM8]
MLGSTCPRPLVRLAAARSGPTNEKTPRGCERSARGSGARWPRRTWWCGAVTADRRACCR